jgi:hypothetical protein
MDTIEHLSEDTLRRPGCTGGPNSRAEGGVLPGENGWPLERVLFALAGTMTMLSALLAATVSSWFLLLTVFVAVNQWLYVTVGNCPASLVLRRAFHLPSAIDQHQQRAGRHAEEVTV